MSFYAESSGPVYACVFGVCACLKKKKKRQDLCVSVSILASMCCPGVRLYVQAGRASPLSMPAVPLGPLLSVGVSSRA